MKHTPGPWVVNDFCTQDGADVAIWTSHDPHTAKSICECHYSAHADLMRGETGCNRLEAEANAKLIAAAPELLEALRTLEVCANTADYCYQRRPENFSVALKSLGLAADAARGQITRIAA